MGAGNSAVVVDLPRCGPMLSPRVPNLVPIPGPRMERETPGQGPRPNYGHPQARARSGCFNEPGAGAVSDGEELGLGRARRLRTPPERPSRAWRVVGVVDHRMPRRRTLVAGNLDWA